MISAIMAENLLPPPNIISKQTSLILLYKTNKNLFKPIMKNTTYNNIKIQIFTKNFDFKLQIQLQFWFLV